MTAWTDPDDPETFILELDEKRVGYHGDWPPPESIEHDGKRYERVMYSQLARTLGIARGAKYRQAPGDGR